jgi:hypothetical protein
MTSANYFLFFTILLSSVAKGFVTGLSQFRCLFATPLIQCVAANDAVGQTNSH